MGDELLTTTQLNYLEQMPALKFSVRYFLWFFSLRESIKAGL